MAGHTSRGFGSRSIDLYEQKKMASPRQWAIMRSGRIDGIELFVAAWRIEIDYKAFSLSLFSFVSGIL